MRVDLLRILAAQYLNSGRSEQNTGGKQPRLSPFPSEASCKFYFLHLKNDNIRFLSSASTYYHIIFLFPRLFSTTSEKIYKAFFGQLFTHSMQRIHSVPFLRFLELSVTSTSIGQTRLHLPQEMHFDLSHFTRNRAK